MTIKSVLVTGASGFLGKEIVTQLLNRNYKVRAFVEKGTTAPVFDSNNIEIVFGDILDYPSIVKAIQGVEYVIHTASIYETIPWYIKHPKKIYEVNIGGVENICNAALQEGVKKLIYASSLGTIGVDPNSAADETFAFNLVSKRSHYEKSKALAEKTALSFREKGLPVVSINPGFLIGPGDRRPTPTGQIILNFLKRRFPCYFDAFFYYSDLSSAAKAHIDVLDRDVSRERYILIANQQVSVKDFFHTLQKVSGIKAPLLKLPLKLVLFFSWLSEGLIGFFGLGQKIKPIIPYEIARYFTLRASYNPKQAESELGYKAASLEFALTQAVEWYRGAER